MKYPIVISAVPALLLLAACNISCNQEQPSRGEPSAQPGAPEPAAGEKGPAPADGKDEGAAAPAPGAAAQPVKPGVPVLEEAAPLAGDWDDEERPPLAAQWLTGGKVVLFELERTASDEFKLTATVDGAKTDLLAPAINPARGGEVVWLLRGEAVIFAYTSDPGSQDPGTAGAARYALRDGKVIQDEI